MLLRAGLRLDAQCVDALNVVASERRHARLLAQLAAAEAASHAREQAQAHARAVQRVPRQGERLDLGADQSAPLELVLSLDEQKGGFVNIQGPGGHVWFRTKHQPSRAALTPWTFELTTLARSRPPPRPRQRPPFMYTYPLPLMCHTHRVLPLYLLCGSILYTRTRYQGFENRGLENCAKCGLEFVICDLSLLLRKWREGGLVTRHREALRG